MRYHLRTLLILLAAWSVPGIAVGVWAAASPDLRPIGIAVVAGQLLLSAWLAIKLIRRAKRTSIP
jgi:hypothetical protein